MFSISSTIAGDPSASKPALYGELCDAARAITHGESDAVANMANVAALIWQFVPGLNWAGFYRAVDEELVGRELVLGPFIGKPACIRIPFAPGRVQGVCGAAAASGATQLVADVHAFAGHIACDADSRAELVVPILHEGRLLGVIDLDSPEPARFDPEDAAGIEALAALLGPILGPALAMPVT